MTPNHLPGAGLHLLDWLCIAAYAVGVLWLGWHYSKQQKDSDEYFTGGGHMSPALIGISLFVTLLSTISYLAQPGEIIKHGPVILAGLAAVPLSYLIVGYILIPALMRHHVSSAYELLEARLGLTGRMMGATMFVTLRLVWMSLLIYITSTALVVIMGIGREWTPLVSAVTGLVTIIYTSIGGLRTVVITDCVQFVLLFGGALLTVVLITIKMGGFAWWPTEWVSTWDTQPLFSLDPTVRATVIGAIIALLVTQVCTAGGDQTAIQRYMATSCPKAARRSFLITSILHVAVFVTLALVGFSLLGYFSAHPELLPPGIGLTKNADGIFPYYISAFIPVGLSGLVVSAMFAAAMSSIDSGVNSITAVVQKDFIERFRGASPSPAGQVRLAKYLAFGIGLLVISASSLMQFVPGNFLEVTQKTTNILVTPIFVLFVLALFVPFATTFGAIAGAATGISTALLIGYWDVFTGRPGLSFQWIGISALAANLGVACAASAIGPKGSSGKAVAAWSAAAICLIIACAGSIVSVAGRRS
jgi:SSS family solute:Na+ symporter